MVQPLIALEVDSPVATVAGQKRTWLNIGQQSVLLGGQRKRWLFNWSRLPPEVYKGIAVGPPFERLARARPTEVFDAPSF